MSEDLEISQYGDLSDDELLAFLNELEDDDSDMALDTENAEESIKADEDVADEHAEFEYLHAATPEELAAEKANKQEQEQEQEYNDNEIIDEELRDKAWTIYRKWYRDENGKFHFDGLGFKLRSELHEASLLKYKQLRQKRKERAKERRLKKIEIQRFAFTQTLIDLSEPIPNEHFKLLIVALTKEHTRMMAKCSQYINTRMTKLLAPLIPRRIRLTYKLYPMTMREHPGFLYIASKEYGAEIPFWVTPNIPYYFEQGTEKQVLRENKAIWLLDKVDSVIYQFDCHRRKKIEKEVKYATKLSQLKDHTYFGLLKYNPFWFETLYNELVKKA